MLKGTKELLKYITRIGVSLSVLLNVVLGGASNQTFSARNYQWQKDGKPNLVILIDTILGFDHCLMCWTYWKVRENKW